MHNILETSFILQKKKKKSCLYHFRGEFHVDGGYFPIGPPDGPADNDFACQN